MLHVLTGPDFLSHCFTCSASFTRNSTFVASQARNFSGSNVTLLTTSRLNVKVKYPIVCNEIILRKAAITVRSASANRLITSFCFYSWTSATSNAISFPNCSICSTVSLNLRERSSTPFLRDEKSPSTF